MLWTDRLTQRHPILRFAPSRRTSISRPPPSTCERNERKSARRLASMTTDLESLFAASADSNADDEHDLEGQTIAYAWSHAWRYTRTGDKHVTVTIDLPPIRSAQALPGCWTWSKAARSRRSPPDSLPDRKPGGTGSRSWARPDLSGAGDSACDGPSLRGSRR